MTKNRLLFNGIFIFTIKVINVGTFLKRWHQLIAFLSFHIIPTYSHIIPIPFPHHSHLITTSFPLIPTSLPPPHYPTFLVAFYLFQYATKYVGKTGVVFIANRNYLLTLKCVCIKCLCFKRSKKILSDWFHFPLSTRCWLLINQVPLAGGFLTLFATKI